jgi:hypothetical protein
MEWSLKLKGPRRPKLILKLIILHALCLFTKFAMILKLEESKCGICHVQDKSFVTISYKTKIYFSYESLKERVINRRVILLSKNVVVLLTSPIEILLQGLLFSFNPMFPYLYSVEKIFSA